MKQSSKQYFKHIWKRASDVLKNLQDLFNPHITHKKPLLIPIKIKKQ